MPKYEVTFSFSQTSVARKIITANSTQGAWLKAEKMIEDGADSSAFDFKPTDGQLEVSEVALVGAKKQ